MTTIATDLKPATGIAYSYIADDETVFINAGVVVRSKSEQAIFSGKLASILVNRGAVYSDTFEESSVYLGQGGKITNEADGVIFGSSAILIESLAGSVVNRGLIYGHGSVGVFLIADAGHESVVNFGRIFGEVAGLYAGADLGSTADHDYENRGSIHSNRFGVEVVGQLDFRVSILNARGAELTGEEAAIATLDFGHVVLDNRGLVEGDLAFATAGRDRVTNSGTIDGDAFLGSGNDRFDGAGGVSGRIFGQGGDDLLSGGAGGDRLNGGAGLDTLFGGGGGDTFEFDDVDDSKDNSTRDFIKDFRQSQHDRIDLRTIDAKIGVADNQDFTFRGTAAFTKAGQVRYVLHDKTGTANDTTSVLVNVDGNLAADMRIELKGLIHLQQGDFVL